MPLEFRCPSCSKLLRTPDESAGKKAKCPQCGTIVDVPVQSVASPSPFDQLAPIPPTPPVGPVSIKPTASPFGNAGSNPYASPAPDLSVPMAQTGRGALTHNKVSFDQIFGDVWAVYRPQMGKMVLFSLLLLGANIALQIASGVIGIPVQATNEPVIIFAFQFIMWLVGMVVQTWLNCGAGLYMLRVARGQPATFNEFGAAGPYFMRAFLVQMVVTISMIGIMVVCMIPAGAVYAATREPGAAGIAMVIGALVGIGPFMYLMYRWIIANFFVIDCNMGVWDALRSSSQYMVGNKLTVFVILLVVGLVGIIFVLFTCGIGFLFLLSYGQLMMTAIYLTATGQPWGPAAMKSPMSQY